MVLHIWRTNREVRCVAWDGRRLVLHLAGIGTNSALTLPICRVASSWARCSMIELLLLLLAGALFASLMVTRITEHPIRIPFRVVESSANTFTTATIELPSVPSISITRGEAKAIGVEIMKVMSNMVAPESEDGQSNNVVTQILKGATPTAQLVSNNNLVVWERRVEIDNSAINGSFIFERNKYDDLTDGDGSGELVLDNEIHAVIEGAGNAAAKSMQGYMLVHLVEFDRNEAVFEMLEQVL